MDNFDPYNALLSIATNIPVLLMTAFVLQRHICVLLVHANRHMHVFTSNNGIVFKSVCFQAPKTLLSCE